MATFGRQKYLSDMGLWGGDKEDARRRALDRAHEIRKFEIELLWKRALFFWGFQVAIMVAVAAVFGAEKRDTNQEFFYPFLAGIGLISALAQLLVNKGSKFWQETWEFHIDMLEEEFEGKVHQLHLKDADEIDAKIISVSKVNRNTSFIFFLSWIAIFVLSLAALFTPDSNGNLVKACACGNWLHIA